MTATVVCWPDTIASLSMTMARAEQGAALRGSLLDRSGLQSEIGRLVSGGKHNCVALNWISLSATRSGSMRQKNRQGGMFQHLACGTAKDRLAETGMAISPHHDQIGISIRGMPDQNIRDTRQGF